MTPSLPIKKPTSGIFVLCLLVSLAIIFFLLFPKFKDYRASVDAKKVVAAELETTKKYESELEQSFADLQSGKLDLAKIDQAIPSKQDISSVYALIERFAKASNLTMSSIQAVDEAQAAAESTTGAALSEENAALNAAGLGVITINMQALGTVDGFVQLLANLEQSLRIIDVHSIDISENKDENNSLSFRTSFKTYYQK